MNYFNWKGNKQGRSIYDTKIPMAICLLLPIIILSAVWLCGCTTTAERGIVTKGSDGKYIYEPKEYMKIRGIGEGKFPEGYEIKGKPMVEVPDLPSTIIGK